MSQRKRSPSGRSASGPSVQARSNAARAARTAVQVGARVEGQQAGLVQLDLAALSAAVGLASRRARPALMASPRSTRGHHADQARTRIPRPGRRRGSWADHLRDERGALLQVLDVGVRAAVAEPGGTSAVTSRSRSAVTWGEQVVGRVERARPGQQHVLRHGGERVARADGRPVVVEVERRAVVDEVELLVPDAAGSGCSPCGRRWARARRTRRWRRSSRRPRRRVERKEPGR